MMKEIRYRGSKLFVSIYDAVEGKWKKIRKEGTTEVTDIQFDKLKDTFGDDIYVPRPAKPAAKAKKPTPKKKKKKKG